MHTQTQTQANKFHLQRIRKVNTRVLAMSNHHFKIHFAIFLGLNISLYSSELHNCSSIRVEYMRIQTTTSRISKDGRTSREKKNGYKVEKVAEQIVDFL